MRVQPRRIVKSVLTLLVIAFIILNLLIILRDGESDSSKESMLAELPKDKTDAPSQGLSSPEMDAPQNSTIKNNTLNHELVNEQNLTAILHSVYEINRQQKIFNREKLEPNFPSDPNSVVIVIQIHYRPVYLRHLVNSLAKARGIENTLVIFSHDIFSNELNDIAESIEAFPVMQIFYPFSMQVYPHEFPGEHPKDCPRNINKKKAEELRCQNAAYPDRYGHYREAKYTQTKHHWFWKMQRVFDELDILKGFQGHVLLLEEDHFVSDDFLHVLRQMKQLRETNCPQCGVLTLATYDKRPSYVPNSGRVEMSPWISARHNMGMAFNRNTWNKIKQCAKQFCEFDDYNWDWTLQYLGMTCVEGHLQVLVAKSPRVFHIGECGVHHKGKDCNPHTKVAQIELLLSNNRQYLFPQSLSFIGHAKVAVRQPKPNGGWGDIRDHSLCLSFVKKAKNPIRR
ncbi:alpha-1,6-mannosyl-glycoprotein 2-beta-N-acetylglucosaminyltransferase-like [Lineus longissimus]|uniref:alpha-1,6-mannosyl-glycoprotein 2-beta-N-acetylglucosaminyltransferase-like n=1 Tax=Lineus longissimus TaxID=88925 RepID=UPI002B4D9386